MQIIRKKDQFPVGSQPDTEEDNISLGFITVKSDAVLLRIESSNTQDYFELEIVSMEATAKSLLMLFTSIP